MTAQLKIKVTRTSSSVIREYTGPQEEAPRWAVTKWYRRILVAPLTIYMVLCLGIGIGMTVDSIFSVEYLCVFPSMMLLVVVTREANKNWYRDRFKEYELLNSASENR